MTRYGVLQVKGFDTTLDGGGVLIEVQQIISDSHWTFGIGAGWLSMTGAHEEGGYCAHTLGRTRDNWSSSSP